MTNFANSGTFALNGVLAPVIATVDPNLTVTFNISGLLGTFNIISNSHSTVTINDAGNVANTLSLDTNGGTIIIGSSGGVFGTINATIDKGGKFIAGSSSVGLLNSGNIVFSTGGGTAVVGTSGSSVSLNFAPTFGNLLNSNDIIDDAELNFAAISSYTVVGTTNQTVSITSGSAVFTFSVSGSNLRTGTFTGPTLRSGPLKFSNDGAGGTDITVCFLRGTRIQTPDGDMAVEALASGDLVATCDAGETIFRPVKWIGYRRIDLPTHPRPETVAPICIQAGAFAENVPHRDLFVSPDHAIFADDKLVCARQLVNGATIRRTVERTSIEYFHVELDGHHILLAEGLPTESYLDTGNRGFFANSDGPVDLHPDLMSESNNPTRQAASCAPFVWDDNSVHPIWQSLANRAAALGHPVSMTDTTADPELRLVLPGRTVRPLSNVGNRYYFSLPPGATDVHLTSRSALPTDGRPWTEDQRRLGVYVERIVLRTGEEAYELPVDHPGLTNGWWAIERNGVALRRWTAGQATIQLPVVDGPAILEICASSSGLAYAIEPEQRQHAA